MVYPNKSRFRTKPLAGNHWKHCSMGNHGFAHKYGEVLQIVKQFLQSTDCWAFSIFKPNKKNWLLTASISNFASPKTPTWAWLVTPSTPRHPQRKGSRPDARLWWHPGGGAMLKSSCLFSDICQPLNYSKFGYIIYIYWNILEYMFFFK